MNSFVHIELAGTQKIHSFSKLSKLQTNIEKLLAKKKSVR
jgi:hypothetical protein